ncbi:MAG: hypothetical protein ACW99V_08965 [Candidatus Thorarchaeota archaeon]
MRRRQTRDRVKKLARARINRLWGFASQNASERPDLARRSMVSAKKIARKGSIRMSQEMVKGVCKECGTVYVSGKNCRVRMRNNRSKHLTVTCLKCGTARRFYVRRQA